MALRRKLWGNSAESCPTLMPLRMVPPWFLQNPQHFPVAIAALAALTTNMCASIATKEQKMKLFPAKVASWGRWQSLSFVMNVKQSLAMLLRNLIQVVTFIFIFRSLWHFSMEWYSKVQCNTLQYNTVNATNYWIKMLQMQTSWSRWSCNSGANIPVVMVTGGKGGANNSVRTSPELLSINGTRLCSLGRYRSSYSHSQTGLLTCGGERFTSRHCYTFSDGEWKKSHTLGKAQPHHGFGYK